MMQTAGCRTTARFGVPPRDANQIAGKSPGACLGQHMGGITVP
jgi:hypothetical protein